MAGSASAPRRIPLVRLPRVPVGELEPTWKQASARRIAASLAHARALDPGGWYVVGASPDLPVGRSIVRVIAGREVTLWRTSGGVAAGPGACPHLGARLDGCLVSGESIVCSWHGLAIGPGKTLGWRPWPVFDDGVLLWVQLPTVGESPSDKPVLATRPALDQSLVAVISHAGRCEPADIVANRLDPWHGAWFHPYAFSHLRVDESLSSPGRLVLEVAYRVAGSWAVPVVVDFTCPDARTIVMTILDGEGAGSVVETHASPVRADDGAGGARTVMTEATFATSSRVGFQFARRVAPLVQFGMRRAAARLWVDDLAYAERLYELRCPPERGCPVEAP